MEAEKADQASVGDSMAYYAFRSLISLSAVLPKSAVYRLTKFLSSTFLRLSKRRRDITFDNLKKAFPDKSSAEIEALTQEVFSELSKTIAEILLLMNNRIDIDAFVINKEEALAKLSQLRAAHPQGWIFMTAHFSNWELGAHFLAKHGYEALAVGREGDNPYIDQKIITPFRQKYGNGSIYKKHAAVAVFKALKRGEIVGILIDQKVNEKEGVKVSFFEREVYTTSLPAIMAEKLDIAVVPVFLPRVGEGQYHLLVGDPVEKMADTRQQTQRYNDTIEAVIRDYPAQWFWMHNRWKIS